MDSYTIGIYLVNYLVFIMACFLAILVTFGLIMFIVTVIKTIIEFIKQVKDDNEWIM